MSKEVKRYGMCGFESGIVEQVDGPYIYVDDYEALLEENRRLESAWKVGVLNRKDELLAKQEQENDRVKAERDALLAERDAQRSVLKEARQVIATALRAGAPDWFETDEDIASHHTIKRIDAALQGEQP